MYHSYRRLLKLLEATKISYYRRPHAPNARKPYGRSLLYLYALPALAPAPGLRPLRPRELPRAPQHLEPRPPEVTGRSPPTLPRHQHVGHHPKQRASAAWYRFSGPLSLRHQPTSPSACRPRSSLPRPSGVPSNLVGVLFACSVGPGPRAPHLFLRGQRCPSLAAAG